MNLLRKIKANPQVVILAFFVILHLILLNINAVEWGDSYRILRGAEYIRDFSYPTDEKRPPLFSAFLALRPLEGLDPVLWGKVFMLLVSTSAFIVFYKICLLLFNKGSRKILWALLLFSLNPVYLYWSLRIYADVFFSLLVLIFSYIYLKNRESLDIKSVIILAFLSALGILSRFEGYILAASFGLVLFLPILRAFFKKEGISRESFHLSLKILFVYSFSVLVFILPYWLWRNPFGSTYFEEPSGRTYDFRMLLNYLFSLAFLFGFTSVPALIFTRFGKLLGFFERYAFFAVFSGMELLLVLAWPAAVPRLFIPIIPILILPLSSLLADLKEDSPFVKKKTAVFSSIFTLLYIVGQKYLVLQFLVPSFKLVLFIAGINLVGAYFLFRTNFKAFLSASVFSMFLWSFGVIWAHKDIYSTIQEGAQYAGDLSGVIAHNDSSSVTPWYLDESPLSNPASKGVYFEYGRSEQLSLENLQDEGYDYLLFTNEHNPALDVDFKKRSYLHVLKVFEKEINGRTFYTKVVEVKN